MQIVFWEDSVPEILNLFSGKKKKNNKKNISKCHLLKFLPSMLSIHMAYLAIFVYMHYFFSEALYYCYYCEKMCNIDKKKFVSCS